MRLHFKNGASANVSKKIDDKTVQALSELISKTKKVMEISLEKANKYQEFFNFFSQEHNLTLTIEQMDEILLEAKKLEGKLNKIKN